MTLEQVFGLYNYWVVICLMMTGFYIVIARRNMIKTVIGLNIFQTSVVLLYITMGKVTGGTAPIIPPEIAALHQSDHGGHVDPAGLADHTDHVDHVAGAVAGHGEHVGQHLETAHEGAHEIGTEAAAHGTDLIYSNPLPSVLMLTAIVVGIATTALALALIVRISEDYGTIEEDEILLINRQSRVKK